MRLGDQIASLTTAGSMQRVRRESEDKTNVQWRKRECPTQWGCQQAHLCCLPDRTGLEPSVFAVFFLTFDLSVFSRKARQLKAPDSAFTCYLNEAIVPHVPALPLCTGPFDTSRHIDLAFFLLLRLCRASACDIKPCCFSETFYRTSNSTSAQQASTASFRGCNCCSVLKRTGIYGCPAALQGAGP